MQALEEVRAPRRRSAQDSVLVCWPWPARRVRRTAGPARAAGHAGRPLWLSTSRSSSPRATAAREDSIASPGDAGLAVTVAAAGEKTGLQFYSAAAPTSGRA